MFPYLKQIESITDSESQLVPSSLPQMEIYRASGAALMDSIAEPWERDGQGCFETNLQNNPYNPFATCEEYKYIQCGMKKKVMKTY